MGLGTDLQFTAAQRRYDMMEPAWDDCDDDGGVIEVRRRRILIARSERRRTSGEIFVRPGDKCLVEWGFDYVPGGPREYVERRYCRIAKGPAWEVAHANS